ncbi:MAG: NUDIX hydrolase [Gemmatimonadaceae bacterium]
MSAKKSRRRGAATIDLVLCSARRGRLHILVMKAAGGTPVLPYTWPAAGEDFAPAARELARDVLGLAVPWLVPGVAMADKRHPAGAALSLPFIGVVGPAGDAPDGATWHSVEALPALAPRQRAMALTALETLRLHMDSSPVAFRMLPAAFTLSELQQSYELLLGRRLHKASFRRALQAAYLVAPTDEWRREGRGRPAQLFQYAPRKRRAGHRSVRFDLLGR